MRLRLTSSVTANGKKGLSATCERLGPYSPRRPAGQSTIVNSAPAPERKQLHRVVRRKFATQRRGSCIDDECRRAEHWRSRSRSRSAKASVPLAVRSACLCRANPEPGRCVVVHVLENEPPQTLFVQRDDIVGNLSAAVSHPELRNRVLPWCLNTRALRSETRSLQKGNHIGIEFRTVVEDGITIHTSLWKHFPHLLHHPISRRMTSDVEMWNPTPAMLDYEEAVQELKRQAGTVKKSKATITARWLARKAS